MKNQKHHLPPRWLERLLSFYCKPELLEDLQGDLFEYFQRNVEQRGVRHARLVYFIDVIKFIRPYTLRTPKILNPLIHTIMIGSYLKTSARSIVRNKMFSSINIVGLAISMSVALVLVGFLADIFSYDDVHVKKDRIYRVISDHHFQNDRSHRLASASIKSGTMLRENMTGIEKVSITRTGFAGIASNGSKKLPISAWWADENFFDIFSFPMLKGNPASALQKPNSIVLTQEIANNLFNDADPLGKSIQIDSVEYLVTGVLENVPAFSHIQFKALVSFSTFERDQKDNTEVWSWTDAFQNYVYVLLPDHGDIANLRSNIQSLNDSENKLQQNVFCSIELQPMKNFVVGERLENVPGPFIPQAVIWVLSGLTLVVILSACFNYANLSVARSLKRSREVGVRKIIGASGLHVGLQFLVEAVVISCLALVLAFVIFLIIRPHFLFLLSGMSNLVSLDLSIELVMYFIATAVTVGVLAGVAPAFVFSKINPLRAMKNVVLANGSRKLTTRKTLITVQFTFSLMFLAAALIINTQYQFFTKLDLGFSTRNILNIQMQGAKSELLMNELSKIPEVTGSSRSLMVSSTGNIYGYQMKYGGDSAMVYANSIDENYIPLHGHKIIAGRNLRAQPGNTETEIIVNEELLKRFHIGGGDPVKALGETVNADGKELQIVGVVRNYFYTSPKAGKRDEPMAFRYSNDLGVVNARVETTDPRAALEKIDQAWKKVEQSKQLQATWYDEQIARSFNDLAAMIKVIGFLCFLTVSIASLGLFGMVVYATEARLKEISIRKVLGASERGLLYMLSKGFLLLILIAAVVAIPITYLFFSKIVLSNVPSHTPINVTELVIGVVVVMMLAFSMIFFQTLGAARSNPAEVLKNE